MQLFLSAKIMRTGLFRDDDGEATRKAVTKLPGHNVGEGHKPRAIPKLHGVSSVSINLMLINAHDCSDFLVGRLGTHVIFL